MEIKKVNDCKKNNTNEVITLLQSFNTLKNKKRLKIINEKEELIYELIKSSLETLNEREYDVIINTYIDNIDNNFNYGIQYNLRLSRSTYYRVKESALNKISDFLPDTLFDVS